jgi:Domain of unknown function (DUF4440)
MRARLLGVVLLVLTATLAAQQPQPAAAVKPTAEAKSSIVGSDAAAEVLAFERDMEAAVVRGDTAYLARIIPADFTFTHGDGWTTGGAPLRVDDKTSWLASVGKQPYAARDLDSVKVELHGDIAITYGRYIARNRNAAPGRAQFTVWFERVYAKRGGQWQYLSHRTVHGPAYEH